MANLIQPSRWHLLNVSAFMMLVGSYSPGPLITGRFLYLELFHFFLHHLKIEIKWISSRQRKTYVYFAQPFLHYLNTWYAMSGAFNNSENHSPDSRNKILKNKCSKYSGMTSCNEANVTKKYRFYVWSVNKSINSMQQFHWHYSPDSSYCTDRWDFCNRFLIRRRQSHEILRKIWEMRRQSMLQCRKRLENWMPLS